MLELRDEQLEELVLAHLPPRIGGDRSRRARGDRRCSGGDIANHVWLFSLLGSRRERCRDSFESRRNGFWASRGSSRESRVSEPDRLPELVFALSNSLAVRVLRSPSTR